jgi:hypothetical protein
MSELVKIRARVEIIASDRTSNPSANRGTVEKSKCRVWCRLLENGSHCSFSSCTECCTQNPNHKSPSLASPFSIRLLIFTPTVDSAPFNPDFGHPKRASWTPVWTPKLEPPMRDWGRSQRVWLANARAHHGPSRNALTDTRHGFYLRVQIAELDLSPFAVLSQSELRNTF